MSKFVSVIPGACYLYREEKGGLVAHTVIYVSIDFTKPFLITQMHVCNTIKDVETAFSASLEQDKEQKIIIVKQPLEEDPKNNYRCMYPFSFVNEDELICNS